MTLLFIFWSKRKKTGEPSPPVAVSDKLTMCCLISYKVIALWAANCKYTQRVRPFRGCSVCLLLRGGCWWLSSLLFRCWFGWEFSVFQFWLEFPGLCSHNTERHSGLVLPSPPRFLVRLAGGGMGTMTTAGG